MSVHEKIRMMREIHHWSQEEMAGKMNMSLSGYAKIERGATKLHIDKLKQIAQIFNIDLVELINSDKGFVFYMEGNNDCNRINYYGGNEVYQAEIEKLKLVISHKDELLAQKQKEIESLQKIIALLEQK